VSISTQKHLHQNSIPKTLWRWLLRFGVTGRYRYVTGRYRYVTGNYRYVTGRYRYVTGRYRYVTGRYCYVTGRYRYVAGRYCYDNNEGVAVTNSPLLGDSLGSFLDP
jgi:hypothetical protein